MKNILTILCLAFLFSISCENLLIKDLPLDETGFEKQLAVQSFIVAGTDSIITLVSENASVLESTFDIVYLDADVSLRKSDTEIAVLEQGDDGRYYHFFDSVIEAGGEYELVIENTKYGDSRTKTAIPEVIEIKDFDFKYNVGTDPLDMTQVSEVSFTIVDPPGENFYSMSMESKVGGLDTFIDPFSMDTFTFESQVYLYPVSTQLDPAVSVSIYGEDIFINDDFFDGQEYRVSVRYSVFNNGGENSEEEIKKLLLMNFTTHSEDSFNYQTSLDRYNSSQDFGLFSEPVSVYTNIDNGLGIFAGSSQRVFEFQ